MSFLRQSSSQLQGGGVGGGGHSVLSEYMHTIDVPLKDPYWFPNQDDKSSSSTASSSTPYPYAFSIKGKSQRLNFL